VPVNSQIHFTPKGVSICAGPVTITFNHYVVVLSWARSKDWSLV
jgi:hypothetical protein